MNNHFWTIGIYCIDYLQLYGKIGFKWVKPYCLKGVFYVMWAGCVDIFADQLLESPCMEYSPQSDEEDILINLAE